MSGKDASIESFIARIDLSARGWMIMDHWEDDGCAIGVALASDPSRLVYVSTFGKPCGKFYYECELPSASADRMYRVAMEGDDVTFEELLDIMELHL